MSRRGWGFSREVRDAAINKWHAENPGNEDVDLDVDHIIAIYYAKELGMHPHEVNTDQNARAVPREEHQKRDHSDKTEMNAHLSNIARFVGRLFD